MVRHCDVPPILFTTLTQRGTDRRPTKDPENRTRNYIAPCQGNIQCLVTFANGNTPLCPTNYYCTVATKAA